MRLTSRFDKRRFLTADGCGPTPFRQTVRCDTTLLAYLDFKQRDTSMIAWHMALDAAIRAASRSVYLIHVLVNHSS